MAPAIHHSSRPHAGAAQPPHVAAPLPSAQPRDVGHAAETTLREYVRIELLVARALAER